MSFGKGHHLHLIDGSAFIFRAYHALPPLTRKSDGLPIGAVSGFCNMLQRYIEGNTGANAPTHIAVIFDKGSHTFRNDIYDKYKANREAMPEDLRPQMPLTRLATAAFNIACEEMVGYEADDIIATLALKARSLGGKCTIISSDKDLMQLVGDGVEMFDAMKNKTIDRDGVFEKFGVFPEKVIDVQALAGDSTDNVPGAPGIGVKTAALLINEFGDLETLLERAGEIKQPKRREALIDFAEQIKLSKRLVELDISTPIGFTIDDLEVREPDPEKLIKFLHEMEFRTLTNRIATKFKIRQPEVDKNLSELLPEHMGLNDFNDVLYEHITEIETLKKWISNIYEIGYVAIDTETTSLNEMMAELVGISLCIKPGHACYIPLSHIENNNDLFGAEVLVDGQLDFETTLNLLRPVLEDESILKIGQNMKYDAKILYLLGINISPIDDTMLLSYSLNAGLHNHSMDSLSERYLNYKPVPIKSLLGTGKAVITFDRVKISEAVKYASEDADITMRLWCLFKSELHKKRVMNIYESLERPLVPILANMELTGVKVDRDILSRMSNSFAQKMASLEYEIHELAGETFNLGSPKQLGEILFEKMKFSGGTKGKTGAYSTGADILEDLSTEHALPGLVLDWRQLAKLKSTYTDALQEHINIDTGRVHTSYLISGTNTGRFSSSDPNLQNIPIRSDEGRKIREAFIAEPGFKLVSLDYSQIELRVLAEIAGIDELKKAFMDGVDIHALTASEMFDVPLEGMDPSIRRQAKAINFGVIYGISGFGLARNLRIPRAKAQAFIDRYFERFPGIKVYMDQTKEFAKENGYVQTLFGRRINTPNINVKGPHSGFAWRAAINAPIQGTAADIIRRAMIRMPNAIKDLPAKMLLQVHDELIFEVADDAIDKTISIVKSVMEKAGEPTVKMTVPLTVEAGVGQSWAEAH
ncbi:MAG: DNA polymerase I [Rhodobacteraceae bacterium]|nr:DNA polymerase I [Paracoccaceae bacterium]